MIEDPGFHGGSVTVPLPADPTHISGSESGFGASSTISWNLTANSVDSDHDTVCDAHEVLVHNTDPFTPDPPTDSDQDGLPDLWETTSAANPNCDDSRSGLDLKAMGADPNVKDIFVEVDWMERPPPCAIWQVCTGRTFAPSLGALEDVTAAFAAHGIRLHIDSGPNSTMNPVTGETWGSRSRANKVNHLSVITPADLSAIRSAYLDPSRQSIFHYALYGDRVQGPASAECASSQCASGAAANDSSSFVITDGHPSWGLGFSTRQESGTFMHELGHNLGLDHGGPDSTTYDRNPFYRSVMNYLYQLGGFPNGFPAALLLFSPDYSNGFIYNDWGTISLKGGSVGAFGAAAPPIAAFEANEIDPATAKALQAFANPGDGTVRFVGPAVLLGGSGPHNLAFDVNNPAEVDDAYTIHLGGSLGVDFPDLQVDVASGTTRRVNIPIDTQGLTPGSYSVTVTLSSSLAGPNLSSDSGTVLVPNMSDPATRAQAAAALAALASPPEGLDPEVVQQILEMLRAQVPPACTHLNISSVNLPTDQLGRPYSASLSACGGTAPYKWRKLSTLPKGLKLNANTGVISGTPKNAFGIFTVTVQVKDATGATVDKALPLTIGPGSVQVTTSSLPNGTLGVAYSKQLFASGGTAPYKFKKLSKLPKGLKLKAKTGLISGTPKKETGTFVVTVQARDKYGAVGTRNLPIQIS
jgi:hypothetical protein